MEKKYLIVRLKYGLCNQLMAISKGIIYGLYSNRNVIFNKFQVDYRNDDLFYSFSDIIDIDNLQEMLNKLKLDVIINSDDNIIGEKINIPEDKGPIQYIENFMPYLIDKKNIDIEYLDIDNPISCIILEEYIHVQNYVETHIKFTDYYIKIANNYKKILKLDKYICIHLRLEDDSIYHLASYKKNNINEINQYYKEKYINVLNNLKYNDLYKNYNIYASTSLGLNDNINNEFYEEIKKKYNLIDKSNLIIDFKDNNYREILAIIDIIIAKDSELFIGTDWSSFSCNIHNTHIINDKKSILIDTTDLR